LGDVRVVVVAETFTPAVNGVVNSVLRVADELAIRGHEPVVIAPSGDSYRSQCGARVPVIRVPSMSVPGYRQLTVARPGVDLLPVLAAIAPDVVHLASPAVLGRAAVEASVELGIPSVAVFQTDLAAFVCRYHLRVSTRMVWTQLRRIHNCADLTLVQSRASADQLRREGIGPLALWARGVDPRRFHPRHRDDLWRARVGDGRMLVGFVGRLAAEKRVELLEPVSRLPGVHLVVVGDGPRARALRRVMPNATFTGQLTGPELGRAMASFDLLAHAGADETFCQVIQEALCAGVPVVATAAGGPLDLVRHGWNGQLWLGDDPKVLAAQVAGLRDDRAELARLRGNARRSVAWRTWSRVTEELLDHYRELIDRRAGTRRLAG
jgi:phosphatidylinositol alpha 1,6-mannosyltransferase